MVKKMPSKRQNKGAKVAHESSVSTHEEPVVSTDQTQTQRKNSKILNILVPTVVLVFALGYLLKSYLIAATVNGQPVTRLAIVKELEKQGGKKVLDAVITKTLIEQEARKKEIKVTKSDVDAEIAKIEKNVTAQGITLNDALKSQGMTRANLEEEIKLQLTLQKLVGNSITVTDKEVEEYIAAQVEQAGGDENAAISKEQAKSVLTQQKQQEKLQSYIESLRKNAKVNYFVQY